MRVNINLSITSTFEPENEAEEAPKRRGRKKGSSAAKETTHRVRKSRAPKEPKKPKEPKDYFIPVSVTDADLTIWDENKELDLNAGAVGIDTETTGLRHHFGDMPWMVSMADGAYNSWCALWPVDPMTRIAHYQETEEFWYLKKVCEDRYVDKTFFNRKFDVRMLRIMGIEVKGTILHDVSLRARVYRTDLQAYKLKTLARMYRGLGNDDETDLKTGINKLRRRAKKAGWKIFDPESLTSSASKKDKAAPDYWLAMYAHILLPDDPEEAERIKRLAEEYCRKDTLRTVALEQFYDKKFKEVQAWQNSYDLELALHPLVEAMEDRGIRTFKDRAFLARERCIAVAQETLASIREDAKNPNFNPNTPAEYANFLFSPVPQGLGLPPTDMTDKGQYKTGYKEISHLAWHPFIQKVTKFKAHEKAVTLFFDKYLDNLLEDKENPGCHIIHPTCNQNSTKTFRFSYQDPNLQQAANPDSSARGADVVQVRDCFGPRPGYEWWLFDYSGQELRLLGGLMKVKAILSAVERGDDIPTVLGNETWGGRNNPPAIAQAIDDLELNQSEASNKDVEAFWKKIGWYPGKTSDHTRKQIIAEQCLAEYDYKIVTLEKYLGKKVVRTRTKMCLYGKAYGAGVNGVVGLLLCEPSQAKNWLNALDTRFPEMNRVAKEWSAFGERNGYIENAYGRRLSVDPEFSYRATNYRIQGSAAEMMKISMLRCWEYLKQTGLDAHIILTIHDELIFEIKWEHCYPWLIRGIKLIMEDHMKYVNIPMSVGISRAIRRWDLEEDFELELVA